MNKDYRRYLFFSDLHSNYFALENFYRYIRKKTKKTKIFFLGDLIGYNNFNPKIIEIFWKLVNQYDATLLMGNHDAKFLNIYFNASYDINCNIPLSGKIVESRVLQKEVRKIIKLCKITEKIQIFNRETILSHGGISSPLKDYYYPDLKFLNTKKKYFGKNSDYIFGHAHHPFIHIDNKTNNRFINVGSLGMARNGKKYGSFLEITKDNTEIKKIKNEI